jgi:septal ring factor EnvC (AmiA/AmiB activator)
MRAAARIALACPGIALCLLLSAAPAHAQREPGQVGEVRQAKDARVAKAERERDLAQLRARIEALRDELEDKESSRREARDALRDSERAISEANRELHGLEAAGREARQALQGIEARRAALGEALGRQQAVLGRLLAARYTAGPPEALRIALSGEDPNEAARRLYYLSLLSRDAARLIEAFRRDVAELGRLSQEAREKTAQVESLRVAAKAEREKIVIETRERRRLLDRMAGDIRKGRREIKTLQGDESRLSRVVEEIAKLLTARPGAGYAPAAPAPRPAAAVAPQAPEAQGTPRPVARGAPAERAAAPSEAVPVTADPFSALRGKLRLPVRGELLARFGSPQQVGGSSSKGVFIRAGEGQQVRAVAVGRVVYADWMRGFGNLMIVDHGESYLSIYGNNEAMLKQAGDAVGAGEPIATVGSTGGNPETGLYFELRHLGKAFDPLRWTSR